jgi:ParB-like chromosome segregation protein Spo0J
MNGYSESRFTDDSRLQIVYWPVSKLTRYIRNPRKNDAVVDRICGSIREYGFVVPILAKADGTVIDGDLRLKGAIKEGMSCLSSSATDGPNPR